MLTGTYSGDINEGVREYIRQNLKHIGEYIKRIGPDLFPARHDLLFPAGCVPLFPAGPDLLFPAGPVLFKLVRVQS